MIDLRSDTFTLPSERLRAAIGQAEVGDDYYREDREVRQLEDYCCQLFRTEAALFVTSGMLANQLAIRAQTTRGDEFVTEYRYHVHLYESAQYAALCQVVLNPVRTSDGVLRAADVDEAIASKPRECPYAAVRLVSVENTINGWQGKLFPLDDLRALAAFTRARGLRLHLDGARLFNAHVATGVPLHTYAAEADSVSVSMTKALGAPFGSVLMGRRALIEHARDLRVWYGSGFHQIGFCARAARVALETQLARIADDHGHARLLATELRDRCAWDPIAADPDTNMVFVDAAAAGCDPAGIEASCRDEGVLVLPFPPHYVRAVTSSLVGEADIRRAAEVLAGALMRSPRRERRGAAHGPFATISDRR